MVYTKKTESILNSEDLSLCFPEYRPAQNTLLTPSVILCFSRSSGVVTLILMSPRSGFYQFSSRLPFICGQVKIIWGLKVGFIFF